MRVAIDPGILSNRSSRIENYDHLIWKAVKSSPATASAPPWCSGYSALRASSPTPKPSLCPLTEQLQTCK